MAIHLPIADHHLTGAPSEEVPRFQGEQNLAFRCTGCGNCCTQTIVPIAAADLARLIAATALPAHKIVTFHSAEDFSSGAEDLAFAELDEGHRVMCLRRRRRGDDYGCRFHGAEGCSVYQHRPLTCRLWPFDITVTSSGQLSRLEISIAVPCPYELDGKNDAAAIRESWRDSDRQDHRYQRQVATWNRTRAGESRRRFLAYLGFR